MFSIFNLNNTKTRKNNQCKEDKDIVDPGNLCQSSFSDLADLETLDTRLSKFCFDFWKIVIL